MNRTIPSSLRHTLRMAGAAVLPLALGACNRAVLNPAGDVALQQRDIILISTALMLLIIVPVIVLIIVFAWRYRRGQGGTYDPHFDHSTTLELAIWSAPLLIIIALGALTWWSTHVLDPFRPLSRISATQPVDPKVAPIVVKVVAMDWKWLFIYPDQGIASVNELVLPTNQQVRFDLTSTNMMNAFYAPTLAGMIYTMPGMQSQMHAVLNRPGTFEGYSANYSGQGFTNMRFVLRGVDQAGFNQWVANVRSSGQTLTTASYTQLLAPSERVPVMHYASVEQGLWARILNRCVAPGTPCIANIMAIDARAGQPAAAAPPATSQPATAAGTNPAAAPTHAQEMMAHHD